MDLHTPVEYSQHFTKLIRMMIGGLKGVEVPPLVAAVGNPMTRIELDYQRARRCQLQLTAESGKRCNATRRKRARDWISMLEQTIGNCVIQDLQAIVPARTIGVPLDALYPALLGQTVFVSTSLARHLKGLLLNVEMSLMVEGEGDDQVVRSHSRLALCGSRIPDPALAATLATADRQISEAWASFCSKASVWIVSNGLKKLTLTGKVGQQQEGVALS